VVAQVAVLVAEGFSEALVPAEGLAAYPAGQPAVPPQWDRPLIYQLIAESNQSRCFRALSMDQNSSKLQPRKSRDLVQFEGINQPVEFIDCEELQMSVKSIFRDLKIESIGGKSWEDPQITLRKREEGYERSSQWLDKPVVHVDPVDAVCDLTVDLIHAFVSNHPGSLCLHCAAVLFEKGLFLFPSTYRAGKSTLSLHLALHGIPLFTDDALPVTAGNDEGMATSLYPRLRIPLPKSVSGEFRSFVRQRIILRNERYCYTRLDEQEQPPFGTTAPISGIILLDLNEKNSPELVPIKRNEAIKEMILRNFARQNKAVDIVDRIYSITEKAQCYRLTYANPDHAARTLIQHFHSN